MNWNFLSLFQLQAPSVKGLVSNKTVGTVADLNVIVVVVIKEKVISKGGGSRGCRICSNSKM